MKSSPESTRRWKERSLERQRVKRLQGKAAKPSLGLGRGKARSGASTLTSKVRKPINKIGPKTRAWLVAWRFLKPRLKAAGRTGCEFRDVIPHDCWGEIWPCHSKKRRLWEGNDIYAIALGCQQIAGYLDEKLSHAKMEIAVWEAIERAGGIILPEVKAA